MDQAVLVSDADLVRGEELVRLLRASKGVRLEAAFWWLQNGEWRLMIVTPVVHERGRLPAFERIELAVKDRLREFQPILDRVNVLSPSEGIITVLDVGSTRRIPRNRFLINETVRGAYVDGAYFYYFEPRTFAPVSV